MEGVQFHVYRGGDSSAVAGFPAVAGSLRERASELTKSWLAALLDQRELDRAAATVTGGIVEHGPRLCAAVVELLESGGEPEEDLVISAIALPELLDARGPQELSAAIEALRSVIWRALREESGGFGGQPPWELGDRLARVLESLRSGALATYAVEGQATGVSTEPVEEVRDAYLRMEEPSEAFLGEEASEAYREPVEEASEAFLGGEEASEDYSGAEETIDAALQDAIALAWARGVPLSVLCVEIDSLERLPFPARPTRPPAPEASDAGLEETLEASLLPEHQILAESAQRAWVIATAWGRARSYDLALRIVDVAAAGGSVSVSVGVAVLGEDGEDADTLIAAAEEARFAAAASGISVLPPDRHRRDPHSRGTGPQAS